jgi:hypothetical protein
MHARGEIVQGPTNFCAQIGSDELAAARACAPLLVEKQRPKFGIDSGRHPGEDVSSADRENRADAREPAQRGRRSGMGDRQYDERDGHHGAHRFHHRDGPGEPERVAEHWPVERLIVAVLVELEAAVDAREVVDRPGQAAGGATEQGDQEWRVQCKPEPRQRAGNRVPERRR